MKKIILCAAIALIIMSVATACGSEKPSPDKESSVTTGSVASEQPDVTKITADVISTVGMNSAVEKTDAAVCDYYTGLKADAIEAASLYLVGSGAYPDEIAAIKFKTTEDAVGAVAAMTERLSEQKAIFETYTPEEFYKLEGASVFTKENYAFLIALSDNDKAKEIIDSYFD